MSSFSSNFNYRLIIIHLVAFWFFYFGGETLGFLHDSVFLRPDLYPIAKFAYPGREAYDFNFIQQMGNFSILAGYIIAWFIARKAGWHWINDAIAFVIAIVLGNIQWFGWSHLSKIAMLPSGLFDPHSKGYYLAPALVMLAIGLLIMFSKPIIRYISKGQHKNTAATAAAKKAKRVR